ncbi:hypothetical protein T01_717 [Trichinella spiralis]|uniref:Uncharacterized protein n=1 Tax=Trichinella spiralis TaxID=6334 RepID=A0A0V0YSV1_TRISP|nr:hypothetical protein T01_717 [Trichinella spiralis]
MFQITNQRNVKHKEQIRGKMERRRFVTDYIYEPYIQLTRATTL